MGHGEKKNGDLSKATKGGSYRTVPGESRPTGVIKYFLSFSHRHLINMKGYRLKVFMCALSFSYFIRDN